MYEYYDGIHDRPIKMPAIPENHPDWMGFDVWHRSAHFGLSAALNENWPEQFEVWKAALRIGYQRGINEEQDEEAYR
ncbi:MAG: hypothetical protein KGL39_00605 [Patescibacteria group bacterium]|nr:hypothetical protein [Patescibacteria group bacterium]